VEASFWFELSQKSESFVVAVRNEALRRWIHWLQEPAVAASQFTTADHVLQRTYDALTSTLWSVCVVLRSGRTSMGLMIVFTCPHTGHDVSSGVLVDEATVSRLPGHKMRLACKECGREHEWWVAEGRLGRVEVQWPVPARIA
jgi:hypothetical protein